MRILDKVFQTIVVQMLEDPVEKKKKRQQLQKSGIELGMKEHENAPWEKH